MSRMRSLCDEYNWLWIWWLNLFALLLQLQSIITDHNQWLPKTRSSPYWTTSAFSSSVTDLVVIRESVTSSASVVRWLTLHSWTFNFSRFLLRVNHWTPLRMPNELESELICDWQFTVNQFVLATSPLRPTTNIFIFRLNTCGYNSYVTSSRQRGWVCHLQLLLDFASAVILSFESRGKHNYLLLFQFRDSPNLEG
jgi:hypothetical protein